MKKKLLLFGVSLIIILSLYFLFEPKDQNLDIKTQSEMVIDSTFSSDKWKFKDGSKYPYRAIMLNDVLYNRKLKQTNKKEIIKMLGEPDRVAPNYMYYQIEKKKLGLMTLNAQFLVIHINEQDSVIWVKTHG